MLSFLFFASPAALAEPTISAVDLRQEPIHNVFERTFRNVSESVVEVRRSDISGYGTGTLFKVDGNSFALTAAHVVRGTSSALIVKDGISVEGQVVYYSEETDIAVISVPEGPVSSSSMRLRIRSSSISTGERTGYCGFPNRTDLACYSGRVSRVAEGVINIHSYAWMGASGSLVLDSRGRAVGILSAVETGFVFGLPQLIEDVVWARPFDESFMQAYRDGFQQSTN
jgi:S1-C subfamily serine protease